MTAWGWVGLALAWVGSLVWTWRMGKRAGAQTDADKAEAYRIAHQAGTRAAATATRATVADAVSLLPSLRCGGGHADHVRRSDVLRIVTPEGTP